jgi:hypothetical protein
VGIDSGRSEGNQDGFGKVELNMAINFYRVLFHLNDATGKPLQSFGTHAEYVAAASSDPASLAAILVANSVVVVSAGGAIIMDSISNAGVGAYLT